MKQPTGLREGIENILDTHSKDIKKVEPCPMGKWTHEIGTGIKAQCGQCGRSYLTPKPYTNKQKTNAILSALLTALPEITEPKREDFSDDMSGYANYQVAVIVYQKVKEYRDEIERRLGV